MYAVVRTGGKQYKVAPGDNLEVEKLAGDIGESIVLDDVLMVAGDGAFQIGQPNVEGASVTARITGQHRGEKILVFRYRPKKRVRVRRGHRQFLTRLQILKISGDGFEYAKEETVEAAPEEVVEEAAAEAAVAAVAETDSVVEVEEPVEAAETVEAEEEADLVDKAVDAVEAVGDAASEAVDAVGDVASDAVEAVSDMAGDAVDAVADKAGDAVEAVGDLADDAVDAVAKNLRGLVGRGRKDDSEADADDAEDNEKKEE